LNDAEIAVLRERYHFPTPIRPRIVDWNKRYAAVFSREKVREWQASIRDLVNRMGTVK
jgi:hypothetical protein